MRPQCWNFGRPVDEEVPVRTSAILSADYGRTMLAIRFRERRAIDRQGALALLTAIVLPLLAGCYAPLSSPGFPASQLPDHYRMPLRTGRPVRILTELTRPPAGDYRLGPGDVLEVTSPVLQPGVEPPPRRCQVMPDGTLVLPKVGMVSVGGKNLSEAQRAVASAYDQAGLLDPFVNLFLVEKATVSVLVLGEVEVPGVHLLPRGENDIGHALAAAGGLTDAAADYIEVHGRSPLPPDTTAVPMRLGSGHPPCVGENGVHVEWDPKQIRVIPLYGPIFESLSPDDITLAAADVVRVPRRVEQVFYVVGELSQNNRTNFTLSERQRELGSGYLLPANREIDVIEAVAMAGYIDPIQSPTTVTVHRRIPGRETELIRVDLMRARSDPRENVLVQPRDIIYLNPDAQWWMRRTFDRILVTAADNVLGGWLRD